MNKAIIIAVLAVLLPLFWLPYYTKRDTTHISADHLYHGQRKFFISLLHAVEKCQPNETIFFSPHSIFRALLLNYFMAEGEAEELLKKTLQLDWANIKGDVGRAYQLEKLARANRRENQTVEFNSAEKLYFSNQVKLDVGVEEMLINSIEVLKFGFKPEEVRSHINKFVEETTNDIIKEFLPPGYITSDTVAVLVNAAFFKGDWKSKFKKQYTKRDLFYKDIHTPVYVEMMEQTEVFNYGIIHELDTQFVEMPYSGENNTISMYVFLPNAIDTFLERVTHEMLDQVFYDKESQRPAAVDIQLPKIALERKTDLTPIFKYMGLEEMIEDSDALHQANIEIDEGGTVAAAATVLIENKCGRIYLNIRKFICNRPFMFLIHDKKSKDVLFAGVYRGPINNND